MAFHSVLAATGQKGGELVLGTPVGTVGFAILMGLAAVIVLFFYGRDLRTKRARWKIMLWALRFLGLACLAVILLEPTLAWRTKFREEANVVVLLDASASMELTDKLRGADARLSIARRHDLLTDDQIQQVEIGEPTSRSMTILKWNSTN